MAVAFEPDLLGAVVTGRMTQEEWEAEIVRVLARRYPDADGVAAVGTALGDVGYVDREVLALVDEVRSQVPVCLVSNASSRLHADLELLGLRDHVDFVVSSADLGVAKPDRRIFAEAARLAGVELGHCLMVDDSATITAAAEAVGMSAHTFTGPAALARWLRSELRSRPECAPDRIRRPR